MKAHGEIKSNVWIIRVRRAAVDGDRNGIQQGRRACAEKFAFFFRGFVVQVGQVNKFIERRARLDLIFHFGAMLRTIQTDKVIVQIIRLAVILKAAAVVGISTVLRYRIFHLRGENRVVQVKSRGAVLRVSGDMCVRNEIGLVKKFLRRRERSDFLLVARREQNDFSMQNNDADFKIQVKQPLHVLAADIFQDHGARILGPQQIDGIFKGMAFQFVSPGFVIGRRIRT